MAVKEGWRGRFFGDFEVGDIYKHPFGRTVTTADNVWFTLLTQNTAVIHFDRQYAEQSEFKPQSEVLEKREPRLWERCTR